MIGQVDVRFNDKNLQMIPEGEFLGVFGRINPRGQMIQFSVHSSFGEFQVERAIDGSYKASFSKGFPGDLKKRIEDIFRRSMEVKMVKSEQFNSIVDYTNPQLRGSIYYYPDRIIPGISNLGLISSDEGRGKARRRSSSQSLETIHEE